MTRQFISPARVRSIVADAVTDADIVAALRRHRVRYTYSTEGGALHALTGMRILIAETGRRNITLVRCSAVITSEHAVRSREDWERLRPFHCVPSGSAFDWTPDTRVKWLYELSDVEPIRNLFRCPEGVRHGRTWLEYRPDNA